MGTTYKARVFLVRLAKVFPFVLCTIVCISYFESLYALLFESYYEIEGSMILYKPISWTIGKVFLYEWYTIAMAVVLSFAMETCINNKLCILYLCANAWERDFFITIEMYEEYVYVIVIANIIISAFFVYKGTTILINSRKQ